MNIPIKKIEFVISAASPKQLPEERLPEIAFVGRSNVGKSSLLNNLVGRKNIARVSQTPGKTQLINFFRINDQFFFVDLPGYGFARVSKAMKAQWAKLLEGYLRDREELAGVVQLVDLRHPPTKDDQQMFTWLQEFGVPVIIVCTKADKLSRSRGIQQGREIAQELGLAPGAPMVSYSSKTGQGRDQLWGLLKELLGGS